MECSYREGEFTSMGIIQDQRETTIMKPDSSQHYILEQQVSVRRRGVVC
jgi:hypothetical protein